MAVREMGYSGVEVSRTLKLSRPGVTGRKMSVMGTVRNRGDGSLTSTKETKETRKTKQTR